MIGEIVKGAERHQATDPSSYAKAILNILADFSDEKARFAGVQKAILNILEDSASEKVRLESTQQATLNILEDFDAEKQKVEQTNREMAKEIAERKQAEEALLKAKAATEAANQELDAFSYSVSHDLRAPLRAVDGFSRILVEDHGGALDDEGRRVIQVIRDGIQKMGRLIDDLLAFSHLGRVSLVANRIDMGALAREVFTDLTLSGAKCEFMLQAMPPALGDRSLVRQVWINLLSNAIKFTGKNEHPMVEVGGNADGAKNCYYVKDNGAGFDMRYYDKLFGVFQRLHRTEEFAGTGVGLAIVQRVVSRHGGRVWAEGKVDEGAVFYFLLPKGTQDG